MRRRCLDRRCLISDISPGQGPTQHGLRGDAEGQLGSPIVEWPGGGVAPSLTTRDAIGALDSCLSDPKNALMSGSGDSACAEDSYGS